MINIATNELMVILILCGRRFTVASRYLQNIMNTGQTIRPAANTLVVQTRFAISLRCYLSLCRLRPCNMGMHYVLIDHQLQLQQLGDVLHVKLFAECSPQVLTVEPVQIEQVGMHTMLGVFATALPAPTGLKTTVATITGRSH